MTRSEEAIEEAAALLFEERTEVFWEDADESVRSPWIRNARITIAAYEAHMRPEVTSVEDAEKLPDGSIIQDDMDLLLKVDGEWRIVEYQDKLAYPITPARVIHWGADS